MIGVFDSGIGGLTVLKSLLAHFPKQDFVYIGDSAHLPYGNKTPEAIRNYGEKILNHLKNLQVEAIVIACNSASSVFTEKTWQGIPLFNVIDPGAKTAFESSSGKRIGVIGTRATVNSQAYTKKIHQISSEVFVFEQACPLLVPLTEEGWTDDPVTNLIVYRYLQPVIQQNVDTLILGCTHYPLLRTSIQKVMGQSVALIESGNAICKAIDETACLKSENPNRNLQIFSTDFSEHFQVMATRILNGFEIQKIAEIEL